MFVKKHFLSDVNNTSYDTFGRELSEGILVFMDSTATVKVYDLDKVDLLYQKKLDHSCGIYFVNNQIYIRKSDSKLYLLDHHDKSLDLFYSAPGIDDFNASVGLIDKGVVVESQSKYENYTCVEKHSRILEVSTGKVLHEIQGNVNYGNTVDDKILLVDNDENTTALLDYKKGAIQWSIKLEESISGSLINADQTLIIPLSNSLIALDKSNGDIVWSKSEMLSHYNYDESSYKLYGIGGKTFEVINVDTGERELQKELKENLHITPHLTYYDDGLLYFSGYRDNNIPVFGAVNVEDGSLVFTQEVEMPGEKSFRKGLDRPVVVGNRLYVRDAMKTLHVYEREDQRVQ